MGNSLRCPTLDSGRRTAPPDRFRTTRSVGLRVRGARIGRCHGRQAFDRPPDIFRFVALGGLLSPMVSATTGVTTLSLAGYASWSEYESIWVTWWLGDVAGA